MKNVMAGDRSPPCDQVESRQAPRILFKLLQVDGDCYFYDTNSNRILQVSAEEYSALSKLQADPTDESFRASCTPEFQRQADDYGVVREHGLRAISCGLSDARALEEHLDQHACSLVYIITEDCNLRCKYCLYGCGNYRDRRVHSDRTLSLQTADQATEAFFSRVSSAATPPFLCFYGGEPLLHWKRVCDIILSTNERYASDKQWFLSTNGYYLTEDKFSVLVDNQVMTRVSLDGPKHVHDRNRLDGKGEPTFDTVYSNLYNLRAADPEYFRRYVSISFVVSNPDDLHDLKEFFTNDPLLQDIPKLCSQINDKSIANSDLSTTMSAEQLYAQCEAYLKCAEESPEKLRLFPFNFWWAKYLRRIRDREFRELRSVESLPNLCIPAAHRLVVHPDGHYSFCIQGAETISVGDVRTGIDYTKIMSVLQSLEEILSQRCTECWCMRFCPMCASFFTQSGHLNVEMLDRSCSSIREHVSTALEMYIRMSRDNPSALDRLFPSDVNPEPAA